MEEEVLQLMGVPETNWIEIDGGGDEKEEDEKGKNKI